jgi:hypothetical protein
LAGALVEIEDPDALKPEFVDVLTEARVMGGVVCASFGATVVDGHGEHAKTEVRVVSRLRIDMGVAAMLRDYLNRVVPATPSRTANAGKTDPVVEANARRGKAASAGH